MAKGGGNKSLYKELTPQVTQDGAIVNTARRAKWKLTFSGVDVTEQIKEDLVSIEIKDIEDSEADDLQIKIADRDGKWLQSWLNETVEKGSTGAKGLKIKVKIGTRDETGKIVEQENGTFILDTMQHNGPSAEATIKATSVDFKKGIRTEKRSKSWKNLRLKNLTKKVAKSGGLKYYYQPKSNPKFTKMTQSDETDLAFLIRCCESSGFSVKICGTNMVVYDPEALEERGVVRTYTFGDGRYISWDFSTGTADKCYDYCTVQYTNPATGKLIKGVYKSPEYKKNENHTELLITKKKVSSKSEAKKYAKAQLNLKNKFERTVKLTIPGDPTMMSGLAIQMKKVGYWSGKYIIHEASHKISSAGYTTTLDMRHINT